MWIPVLAHARAVALARRCRRRRCSSTAWTTSRTRSNVLAMATSSAPNSPAPVQSEPTKKGLGTRMSCARRPTAWPPPRVSCAPADRPGRHERRRIRRIEPRCVGMDQYGWSPHRWAKPDCRTATACDNWPGYCQCPLSKSRPLSSRATPTARSPLISGPDWMPRRSAITAADYTSYRPRSIPPNPPMIWCEPNARTSRWRRCCGN